MTDDGDPLFTRHVRFGWYALACFSVVGIGLELLHAFKQGYYLDVGSETRRLMWRLGHAHGSLLALVNVAFGCCAPRLAVGSARRRASACLIVAAVLMPLGFFLGGAWATPADPSPLVALVPAGAVLLVVGAWSAARAVTARA
jgi:hypothetical protein